MSTRYKYATIRQSALSGIVANVGHEATFAWTGTTAQPTPTLVGDTGSGSGVLEFAYDAASNGACGGYFTITPGGSGQSTGGCLTGDLIVPVSFDLEDSVLADNVTHGGNSAILRLAQLIINLPGSGAAIIINALSSSATGVAINAAGNALAISAAGNALAISDSVGDGNGIPALDPDYSSAGTAALGADLVDPGTLATTLVGALTQVFYRLIANKVHFNPATNLLTVYQSDGVTVAYTQTVTITDQSAAT
jgi:hypothetical protein